MNSINCLIWQIFRAVTKPLLIVISVIGSRSATPSVVNDVNALKAALSSATPVVVLDYYSSPPPQYGRGGRGGGTFRWVPSGTYSPNPTDDGGFYIASNNGNNAAGIWERVLAGEIPNVKMWGAKGDGTTDDTAAIRNAVNGVRNCGNHLLFPAGTYQISDTIVFQNNLHLQGEGILTSIRMANSITDKDIFQTQDAAYAMHGNLVVTPDGNHLSNSYGIAGSAHGMLIQDFQFMFGDSDTQWQSTNYTGAAISLFIPGEDSAIRNIWAWGGGFGVRSIGGGQPGLHVQNASFFYQSIAGICVEGFAYTDQNNNPVFAGSGGPENFTGVSGDSMSSAQVNASLILFSNYWANAVISDLGMEGLYPKGVIRCVAPPDTSNIPFSVLNINGGTFNGGNGPNGVDYIVLESPAAKRTPVINLQPGQFYGCRYLINDIFANRQVSAPPGGATQVPLHGPIRYESAIGLGPYNQSRLTRGDSLYLSFTPQTAGWYRVVRRTPAWYNMGGRLAINSTMDSSEFEFSVDSHGNLGDANISILRKSKAVTSYANPSVTKARAVAYWDSTLGDYCASVEIYVAITGNEIRLTLPLEGRDDLASGVGELIQPEYLDNSANANYLTGLTAVDYTGPQSLLR